MRKLWRDGYIDKGDSEIHIDTQTDRLSTGRQMKRNENKKYVMREDTSEERDINSVW